MTSRYPKTLFITPAAFNHVTGGGITFSALFRGWPADRLATVHNDTVPTADDVCRHYYRLGPPEISRWPRLRAPTRGPAATPPNAMPSDTSPVLRLAKNWIVGNGWPDSGYLSPALEDWIAVFRPQLLYTILGKIGMMELVDAVRSRFSLPLVVHIMDDWPSHLYRGGVLSFAIRARMNALLMRLVGAAAERMAIGDAMAEAYARRYSAPFSAFQNAIDIAAVDSWTSDARGDKKQTGHEALRVLYVGSIFDNAQAQSLIDIADAVARLAASGHAIQFDLYSPLHLAERFRQHIEVTPAVRLHDTVTDDACFFRLLASADILVMPVNFDAHSIRLIRYSMPTKLPAYLASGTPTLVYGPSGVAQIEDARRHGWGYVVDRRGVSAVAAGLVRLAEDVSLRKALISKARALAADRHDAATVRRAFQARLAAVAASHESANAFATASCTLRQAAIGRESG